MLIYSQIVYYHTLCDSSLFLNSDPEFVSSAFIQEDEKNNPTGEDDKIYFFFTEVAKEYDLYAKVKVPRVARVCKVGTRASLFSCLVSLVVLWFGLVVVSDICYTVVLLSADMLCSCTVPVEFRFLQS